MPQLSKGWVDILFVGAGVGARTYEPLKLINRWLDFDQKVSEYDQEIPQSHTADQPTAP